jgi:hypothetical protein
MRSQLKSSNLEGLFSEAIRALNEAQEKAGKKSKRTKRRRVRKVRRQERKQESETSLGGSVGPLFPQQRLLLPALVLRQLSCHGSIGRVTVERLEHLN